METHELQNSLSDNWSHQRATNDEVIVLREKVAQLEAKGATQWRFISGVITAVIGSIFYFGSLSNQIANNTQELEETSARISNIGPQVNVAIGEVEQKLDEHISEKNAH